MQLRPTVIRPSRDQVLFVVLIGLPILAYAIASAASMYVDLDFKNETFIRSIAPFFDKYYIAIVEKSGVQVGNRFLIISLAFVISFLMQVNILIVLAVVDHRNRFTMAGITPKAVFANAGVGALFVSLFYFPDSYLSIDNRTARAFFFTDLKYFYVAAILGFNSITPYVVLRLLFASLTGRY